MNWASQSKSKYKKVCNLTVPDSKTIPTTNAIYQKRLNQFQKVDINLNRIQWPLKRRELESPFHCKSYGRNFRTENRCKMCNPQKPNWRVQALLAMRSQKCVQLGTYFSLGHLVYINSLIYTVSFIYTFISLFFAWVISFFSNTHFTNCKAIKSVNQHMGAIKMSQ